MIKNLNDLLSILVLVITCVYCIRIFVWSYIKKEEKNHIDETEKKWQLILDYIDNEEE